MARVTTYLTNNKARIQWIFHHYGIIEGMLESIAREKQLKIWHRDWKINLIKEVNPTMEDLAAGWYERVGMEC